MKKKTKQPVVKPVNQKIVNVAVPALKERDVRLPAVGTVITKIYRGKSIEVKVLENGFEYQGKTYKSISRVAMEIVKRPIHSARKNSGRKPERWSEYPQIFYI